LIIKIRSKKVVLFGNRRERSIAVGGVACLPFLWKEIRWKWSGREAGVVRKEEELAVCATPRRAAHTQATLSFFQTMSQKLTHFREMRPKSIVVIPSLLIFYQKNVFKKGLYSG